MARVDRFIDASPAAVFAVLADGWYYSDWVTGSSHVRAVEADWPAVGAKLYHASGVWPVVVRDETVVVASSPSQHLELIARGWPLGEARVDVHLEPEGPGTRIVLVETPSAGPGRWLDNRLLESLLARRNVEALARLAVLAERRTLPVD